MTDKNRKLWLDTRGAPVITTTKNGEANAIRWGWTEAKAVAADALAARVPVQGEPNDLIAEARRLERDYGDPYEVMSHMSELADALEATLGEPGGCSSHRLVQHRDGKPPWCRACSEPNIWEGK